MEITLSLRLLKVSTLSKQKKYQRTSKMKFVVSSKKFLKQKLSRKLKSMFFWNNCSQILFLRDLHSEKVQVSVVEKISSSLREPKVRSLKNLNKMK